MAGENALITDVASWINYIPVSAKQIFFSDYEHIYVKGLAEEDKNNHEFFKQVFYDDAGKNYLAINT